MEEDVVMSEKQPKLWLAILSAIGMGLLGCIVWGFLYYLGYIAWAAALLVVLAAGWAYKKLNLKMDTKGYIIISIIAAIEVVITMLISLNIGVMIELGGEYGFFECFSLIMQVLQADSSILTSLIVDIVLSLVMIVVGVLIYFFAEKSSKKKAKQKEENDSKQNAEDFIIDSNAEVNDNEHKDE